MGVRPLSKYSKNRSRSPRAVRRAGRCVCRKQPVCCDWKTTLGDFRLKSLHCKSSGRRRAVFISRYTTGINSAAVFAPSNTRRRIDSESESLLVLARGVVRYYFYEKPSRCSRFFPFRYKRAVSDWMKYHFGSA